MNIRNIVFLMSAAAALGSCATPADEAARSPKAAKQLAEALEGRVAGEPVDCIRNYRTTNIEVIDDWTILFREGRTVYVQNPAGGCPGIGNQSKTLITRAFGVSRTCRGDINRLVSVHSRMPAGSCIFTAFVPYTKPAA